jgi:hypothetical protein
MTVVSSKCKRFVLSVIPRSAKRLSRREFVLPWRTAADGQRYRQVHHECDSITFPGHNLRFSLRVCVCTPSIQL